MAKKKAKVVEVTGAGVSAPAVPQVTLTARGLPEKKILLLGTTPSRLMAPMLNDPTWEVWTMGPGGKDANRWNRLFEIHGTWPEDFKGYLNDLSVVKKPQQVVFMRPIQELMNTWATEHKKVPDVYSKEITGNWEAAAVYPKQHIIDKYGRMWLSSTISWCVALALEENVTDLALYGIDLESGEEYITQFHGARHLVDVLSARSATARKRNFKLSERNLNGGIDVDHDWLKQRTRSCPCCDYSA